MALAERSPSGPTQMRDHHVVSLMVRGRRVVVVGGGTVAAQTATDLVRVGAQVLVVAPQLVADLERLASDGALSTCRRTHRPVDLLGAALVHAATEDPVSDDAVCRDADQAGVLWVRHSPAADVAAAPRRVLVLGGSRSGKSALAEAMLATDPSVVYVATGPAPTDRDPEWADRVRQHQLRRPRTWGSVDDVDLVPLLTDLHRSSSLLVDAVTTWLAGAMDDAAVWHGASGADAALADRVAGLLAAWSGPGPRVIAVSDEVGCGVVPATASGRRFRDELGRLNAQLAATSDQVWRCTAGIGERLR